MPIIASEQGRIVNNESEDIMRMLNRYLTGDRVTEADWRCS